ncbi:MAG: UDP-N-acetylmuramoyl-tripeptide--D-alanyl-D-alanine ligase, partial [Dehalococcoidia bacterium]
TEFVAREMRSHGYDVSGEGDFPITGGAADSRLVRAGDLFAAFRGEHADGNTFVGEAFANGAVAVVCDRQVATPPPDSLLVVAPSTTRAMHQLANAWRRTCKARVLGITGTVGKTTAKELTADVLSARFHTHRSAGNLNSREGLPLALMSLQTDHELSVLEMAMDSSGEIEELCRVAEPEAGVVLNVGLTHISRMGSIEAIQAEKLSLVRGLPPSGTAILNADDVRVGPVASELACRVLTFGAAEGASVRRGPITDNGLEGTTFPVTHNGTAASVHSPLPGAHVVPAALAAISAGLAFGMTLPECAEAVAKAGGTGRMRVIRRPDGVTIIDDRYNASPASLAGAMEMLRGIQGRRLALVGEMAELGRYEEREHRLIGSIAARCCDLLVAVGPACVATVEQALADGLTGAHWFETKEEAAAFVAGTLRPGDTLVVKASRSQAFETILPMLEAQR